MKYMWVAMAGVLLTIVSQHVSGASFEGAGMLGVFLGGIGGILVGRVAAVADSA